MIWIWIPILYLIGWCWLCSFNFKNFLGNGYITTSTLKEILKELDDKITSDELDMMIAEIDADGSGTVDFDGKYTKTNANY